MVVGPSLVLFTYKGLPPRKDERGSLWAEALLVGLRRRDRFRTFPTASTHFSKSTSQLLSEARRERRPPPPSVFSVEAA